MIINITWDSSVANAPAGFQQAVQAAVQYFETAITSPVTLNLCFGWGEVAGQALGASSASQSVAHGSFYTYSTVAAALTAAATSADAKAAASTLPIEDPTHGGGFYLTSAEAKALGLNETAPGGVDGYVGLNSSLTYTFDPTNRAVAGAYDAIGLIEHEISEVLGRASQDGLVLPDGPTMYTPLDLFKYSAPGVRDFTKDGSYFSVDGQTLLTQFNDATQNIGDAGDWASSAPATDAFDAFSQSGTQLDVSATDLRLLNVLGYDLSPVSTGAPATPSAAAGAQTTTLTVTADASLAQGASLHVTGAAGVEIEGAASGQTSPSFTNSGQINVDGSGPIEGVDEGQGSPFTGSIFTNTATGALYVDAASGAASGFSAADASSAVDNAGLIQVVAGSGDATGLANAGTGGFTNESTGQVVVWASGQALGVAMDGFANAGLVQATGASATAVESWGAFTNSGTIVAADTASGSGSVAVQIDARGLLTNTGTIRGDDAFQANDAALSTSSSGSDIDIVNSGLVVGKIDTGAGPAEIHNTGTIDGAIVFGDSDSVYDGSGGRQAGGVFLGSATNTVTLGDDGEVVYGGGLADTITGGAGDDEFVIESGDNVIDGGGGDNTLSLADTLGPVTVDLGAGTATATGADTIRNIQCVIAGAYAATFKAGASAAKFVGGSGYDTFVGGAGNDTLIAGKGGGALTGGGGNNTFIYQQGDKQVVITDFGANGDQDVLNIYGYGAPQSVTQQGSDTLITLSGTDSILLKNVQASSLTASEVTYSSAIPVIGPALPTQTPIGSSPLTVTRDLTIDATTTLALYPTSGDTYALTDGDPNGGSGVLRSIDNFGEVTLVGNGATIGGVTSVASYAHGGAFTNEAGAVLGATAFTGTAYGLYGAAVAPDLVNKGLFQSTAVGGGAAAYGVLTPDPDFHFLNASTGEFDVYSQTGAGYGLSVGAAQVENDGAFNVVGGGEGAGIGVGIDEEIDSGSSTISNSGTIHVNGDPSATAIEIGGTGGAVSVTNSGSMRVDITGAGEARAIQEVAAASAHAPQVSLTNTVSGFINGEIDLGQGQDSLTNQGTINVVNGAVDPRQTQGAINVPTTADAIVDRNAAAGGGGRLDIVNSGVIVGDIVLDGDGAYSGVGGEIAGDIELADGSDTIDLRGGTLDNGDRIDIAPTRAGAAISDVIYTGAAGGLVSLHAGDANLHLTLTGQGATSLQLDEASTAATWSRNADGSWTVRAGADGTATLTNVQTLNFTNRTVTLQYDPKPSDLDGDGTSDVLWRNASTGQVGAWESSRGGGPSSLVPLGSVDAGWSISGLGDFNGDAKADVLFENAGTRQVGAWESTPGGGVGFALFGTVDAGWTIAGVGDFNGDGRSDVLLQNASTGQVGAWETTPAGGVAFASFGTVDAGWTIVGVGDFNGDGRSDVLFENAGTRQVGAWEMTASGGVGFASFGTVDAGWTVAGVGDFNGDGKSDVLFQNASTGQVGAWESRPGGGFGFANFGSQGAGWTVAGVGDYDGDGTSDVLWRNASTGDVGAWESSKGVGPASFTDLGVMSSPWTVASDAFKTQTLADTHDFNAGGKSSVLLQNTNTGQAGAWEMTPGGGVSFSTFGTVDAGWSIEGVGDINGDAKADVLFENASTRQVGAWEMTASGGVAFASLGTVDAGWSIAGVGDVNGDGRSDVLFENASTRQVGAWESRSTGGFGFASFGTVDAGWTVAGVGDFNGDGRSDVLLQNTSTRQVGAWEMTASGAVAFNSFGTLDAGWSIAGVGDFNGDGRSDVLFENASTRQVGAWETTASGGVAFARFGTMDPGWAVAAVGDYNGDGKSDVLFQNASTGQVGAWESTSGGGFGFATFGTITSQWRTQA